MDSNANEILAQIFIEGIKETIKEGAKEIKIKPFFKWLGNEIKARDILKISVNNYRESLEDRYGNFRIFCMSTPAAVRSIYVRANFIGKLSARSYKSVESLENIFRTRNSANYQDVVTFKGTELFSRISNKIVIYGKPGAGKTTFLKRILLHCIDGEFHSNHVPIFITLKTWADSKKSLFDFIKNEFEIFNFPSGMLDLEQMLKRGKCLILLDGLDEINEHEVGRCNNQIDQFVSQYYGNNFMMTCRIAARSYIFEHFAEVEIADFDKPQISAFVKNWFGGDLQATNCLRAIFRDPNILEMAKTPLLLTMLCASFEGTLGFPNNRAELYEDAIDVLLKKWDSSRSIERDELYKHLSLKRKEGLLSLIAFKTFSSNKPFMSRNLIETYIRQYVENVNIENIGLLDEGAILNSMEAQHGLIVEYAKNLYSFSHLTFQEYYVAKYFKENGLTPRLVEDHFGDNRWEEVFILIANMLSDVEFFYDLLFRRFQSLALDDSIKETILNLIEAFFHGEYDKYFKQLSTEELSICPAILVQLKSFEFSKKWLNDLEGFELVMNNVLHIRKVNRDSLIFKDIKERFESFNFYTINFLTRCLDTEINLKKEKRKEYRQVLESSFENKVRQRMKVFAFN